MTSVPSDIALYGFVTALLAHAGFLVLSWRNPGTSASASRRWMHGAMAATAVWAGFQLAGVGLQAPAGLVLAGLFDLLRYGAWFGLLLNLFGRATQSPALRRLRWASWSLLAVSLAVSMAQWIGPSGGLGRVIVVIQLALPLMGLLLLEQVLRNLEEDSRWQAKPVLIGLACVFGYDVYLGTDVLLYGWPDPVSFAMRGFVHSTAIVFLYVAMRRSVNWSSKLQVSHSAAFYSATFLLAGVYLLLVSALGYYVRYFGGEWGKALQVGLLMAGLTFLGVLLFSGGFRSRLRVFVGKHFYRYRYNYREEWLQFTALLSTHREPTETAEHIVRGMARLVECPAGSLWSRAAADGSFMQSATWNCARVSDSEPGDSPLTRFLRQEGWVIDLDEFRASPRRYGELALPTWLLGVRNGWLVVPLLAGDELQGFVVLARPLTPIKLNWEVLDLLKTVGRQAAAYLAQMQAAEALLEARKFDAFNRMSAFVVHDLKNIVAQLSLMLKNAQRLADNPEFQQDMLLTVESSLEKMRRLMLQLREGATPPGGSRGVELQPIVQRLQAMARSQGRELIADSVDPVATRGHDERLERVLGHLVQNALDATPATGRVWIDARRVSGQIRVEVGDTGAGMSEEFIRTRLFKPFSSTKHNGMGIGTYESHQYIRELGGDVRVHSAPGQGTRIEVTLPVFETHRGSDLMPLDAGRP